MTTYAYVRTSTEEQDYGLDAQRRDIRAVRAVDRWVEDRVSGSVAPADRPALGPVLEEIAPGDVLVVATLDRLSRSIVDFGSIMERARRDGWSIVILDLGVDMETPVGEFVANVLASAAQLERRLISQRTKKGLAEARARGVHVGRPRSRDPRVVARVRSLRTRGWTLRRIADHLQDQGVPTSNGGRWHASTVRMYLATP